MDDLIICQFDGQDYVMVEECTDSNLQIVYLFENDENELFCYKQGEQYEIITDEQTLSFLRKKYLSNVVPDVIFTEEE